MSEQEEGRLRTAGTTAVVVVGQQASQAEPDSGNKQEQCESSDAHQKWSKVSVIPLPKAQQVAAASPRSLHVPDLKTFETIELAELGSGSAAVDTTHQCVETSFLMKMESEPIVPKAVKHFETTFPAKIDSEPMFSRVINPVEGTASLNMDVSPPVINRLKPTDTAIFMNVLESESSLTPKPSEPVAAGLSSGAAFEGKPTKTRVYLPSEKASDTGPLEMQSMKTILSLEHTSEPSTLEMQSTKTILPLEHTSKPSPLEMQSTKMILPLEHTSEPSTLEMQSTKTLVPLEQTSETSPLEMQSTKTSLPLEHTSEPNPLDMKSTMTILPLKQTSEPSPLEMQSTKTLVPLEQTSEPSPLEMQSTTTILPLEHTSEPNPLKVKPTMTEISRHFDNTEHIPVEFKSTMTKLVVPLERVSDLIPLEIKSTITTVTLQEIFDPVPLEVKSTMTTLPLGKTEPIPLKPTISRLSQPLEKTVEEESDNILEDSAVQPTCRETRVTDWSYDQDAGGLPRTRSMSSRLSHAARQLFCCGVAYSPPSEDAISTPRCATGI